MDTEEIEHKQKLLDLHRTRFYKLLETEALQGIDTPTSTQIEIDQLRKKIQVLETELAGIKAISFAPALAQPAVSSNSATPFPVPEGWVHITEAFLAHYRVRLTEEQVLSYFDGRIPHWEHALSPVIPRRAIVDKLKASVFDARQKNRFGMTLLVGAGGEGKSTALRQAVCDLVNAEPAWNILWHDDPDTPLPPDQIVGLTSHKGSWLIVSDDADLIARHVFEVVKQLRKRRRTNFHFLLCCRDSDWKGIKANQWLWEDYVDSFPKLELRGITQPDAELIVQAWSEYKEQGLGKLAATTFDRGKAASKLVGESKLERYSQEGTFLGALLRVRYGKDLKYHIKRLLLKLEHRPAPGGTLLKAFAYIAALHAENLFILSKPILAEVLSCTPAEVSQQVVGPLGAEAVGAVEGQYILTRHRAIAEVAVDLLAQEFDFDFEEIYVDLVKSANQLYLRSKEDVPNPGKWAYLSDHFFDQGKQKHNLGIRLAQEVIKSKPYNPFFIVHLSELYRKAGQPDRSRELFHNSPAEVIKADRACYHEWGTVEGSSGNYCLDAWLSALALADAIEVGSPDKKRAVFCLNGLSIAFHELFEAYGDPLFIEACGAASQLVLALDRDGSLSLAQTRLTIQRNQKRSRDMGVTEVDLQTALARLQAGVAGAWARREDDLPEWVQSGDDLTFQGLAHLLSAVMVS